MTGPRIVSATTVGDVSGMADEDLSSLFSPLSCLEACVGIFTGVGRDNLRLFCCELPSWFSSSEIVGVDDGFSASLLLLTKARACSDGVVTCG